MGVEVLLAHKLYWLEQDSPSPYLVFPLVAPTGFSSLRLPSSVVAPRVANFPAYDILSTTVAGYKQSRNKS